MARHLIAPAPAPSPVDDRLRAYALGQREALLDALDRAARQGLTAERAGLLLANNLPGDALPLGAVTAHDRRELGQIARHLGLEMTAGLRGLTPVLVVRGRESCLVWTRLAAPAPQMRAAS